jgi:hypothetical protein
MLLELDNKNLNLEFQISRQLSLVKMTELRISLTFSTTFEMNITHVKFNDSK